MNFLSRQAARANLPPHVQEEIDRVTQLIEKCTSDILLQVDWAVNMEVVDATNRASCQEARREIVRQVRKRLQHRSTRVVSLALTLAETLVKNCNTSLHREVATPKFMAQMARIARTYHERTGRDNLEVADKALDLIQSWGETFLPQSGTMPLFSATYHELRREGLPFRRQYDDSAVPVLTPQQTVPITPKRTQADEEVLGTAETTVTMLKDIMATAGSIAELESNEIFMEVLEQGKRLVRQLQETIEIRVVEGGEFLEEYFNANDALQLTIQTWEGVKTGSISLPLPREQREERTESVVSEDIDDFLAGGADDRKPAAKGPDVPIPALPKPPERDNVPKLPPSRRDSFGKHSSRPSRLSRGASAGADLLDIGALSIDSSEGLSKTAHPAMATHSTAGSSANANFLSTSSAGSSSAGNPFELGLGAPGARSDGLALSTSAPSKPTVGGPVRGASAGRMEDMFSSAPGLAAAPNLDPFAAVPPLPPPRTYVSPRDAPVRGPVPSPQVQVPTQAQQYGAFASTPGKLPSPTMSGSSISTSASTSRPYSTSYPPPPQAAPGNATQGGMDFFFAPAPAPAPTPPQPQAQSAPSTQPFGFSAFAAPSQPQPQPQPNAYASFPGVPTQPFYGQQQPAVQQQPYGAAPFPQQPQTYPQQQQQPPPQQQGWPAFGQAAQPPVSSQQPQKPGEGNPFDFIF